MERRAFIISAVAGGVGLLEYASISHWMNNMGRSSAPPVEDYEKYGERAAVMAITPNDDFYVMSKGTTPQLRASKWQLNVDGLVDQPFTLSYRELLALPRLEKIMTLECISNPIGGNLLGNARWTGTALKPLLERARPRPEATYVAFCGADGLSSGHPLERARNQENFIAYQMNGDDLPPDHGYPARAFIPGKFGMKQPKWLTRIQFVDKAYLGYWESQGWSDLCERWAHARFGNLKEGTTISGTNFEITGYAIGNLDGIRSVEISFDDGTSWQTTSLLSNPAPFVWTFWKYVWVRPQPGAYRLRLRTVDGQGRVEGYEPRNIFPDGATGQQVMKVNVV
jgi:DMSO/TMAO reductase YedYZ molybdopterin-dependent catalytic subunit